ncbi:MAG: class I adenylate-forming enzyme family protein [Candidatus Saccharibacteria bacterium]|nr:class I adenylate-forming enzyme family protein [Candidatus Saccharibacteria bacterium]
MLKIKHQKRDPFVPPISVSALFTLSCLGHSKDVAVNQNERDFTRKEMKRDRKMLAKVFLQLGVKSGDIIVVATGRPIYESIMIFLAANKIGAAVAYLSETTPRDTLLYYIEEFKSPLVITYDFADSRIKRLKKDAKTVKNVINLSPEGIDKALVGRTLIRNVAEKYKGRVPRNTFSANKTALVTFTSGSTSGPKPLTFTNNALVAGAVYNKTAAKVKMWDKKVHTWMQFVTLNYPYGFWVSAMSPILGGGKTILTPDVGPERIDYYFKKNPDVIFGSPAVIEMLHKQIADDTNLDNLKMFASGGDRLYPEMAERTIELLRRHSSHAVICNGYGLGEVLGLISTSVGQTYHPGTAGKIPAGVHVMVIDSETGEELGFNRVGIVCVNGKHMLTEYYNLPEINKEKFRIVDGRRFLITDDLASISPTGFVTIVGRSRFFINNHHAKVYYEYVRGAIARSELIKSCQVVKGPDSKLDLAIYAFVVLKDGVSRNNQTRRAIIKTAAEPYYVGHDRIALKPHELPKRVVFLDELPLTQADKVDFRKLEAMAREIGKSE